MSEPRADRGPRAGSPRGVEVATGPQQPDNKATDSPPISNIDRIAIIRLEQFYPFPLSVIKETIAKYPHAKELVWCQEEPKNMGAWTFMESRLENLMTRCDRPRYVGRAESPSPATGSYAVHVKEQEKLVREALTID